MNPVIHAVLRRAAAASAALALVLAPWLVEAVPVYAAHDAEHVEMRVEVSYRGWNGHPELVIDLEQGQRVDITFVWADTAVPDNAHRIAIEGYEVETKLIDVDRRETTLSFVADRPGQFVIECNWKCEGHDDLKGVVRIADENGVVPETASPAPGGEAPVGSASAEILLAAPVSAALGEPAFVQLQLLGSDGTPLADRPVALYEEASFLGAPSQEVLLARGSTNAEGVAHFPYMPRREGDRLLRVRFDGDLDYAPAAVDVGLSVSPGDQTYVVEPPTGIPGVNRFLLVGILTLIWGTMLAVAVHVVAIARADGESGEEVTS